MQRIYVLPLSDTFEVYFTVDQSTAGQRDENFPSTCDSDRIGTEVYQGTTDDRGSANAGSASWSDGRDNSKTRLQTTEPAFERTESNSWAQKLRRWMTTDSSRESFLRSVSSKVQQVEIAHPSMLSAEEVHEKLKQVVRSQKLASKKSYYTSWGLVPLTAIMTLIPGPNVWLAANLVHLCAAYDSVKAGDALDKVLHDRKVVFSVDQDLSTIYGSEDAWEEDQDTGELFLKDDMFGYIGAAIGSTQVVEVLRHAKQECKQQMRKQGGGGWFKGRDAAYQAL